MTEGCVRARLWNIVNRKMKGKRWREKPLTCWRLSLSNRRKQRRSKKITLQKYLIHQRVPSVLINSALSRRFQTLLYFPPSSSPQQPWQRPAIHISTFADDVLLFSGTSFQRGAANQFITNTSSPNVPTLLVKPLFLSSHAQTHTWKR